MNDKTQTLLYILVTPFVVSACVEFFPPWLYWPIALLGGMIWIGALARLGDMP